MSGFNMYINICNQADAFTGCVLQCMPWNAASHRAEYAC